MRRSAGAGGGCCGRVVVCGLDADAAAEAAGVSVRCGRKWVGRYREEGEAGLRDRSSAPRRVANRTPADRVAAIVVLRQLRMTAAEIAETFSMPLSTVSAVLTQRDRPARPVGLEPAVRYEHSRPGELVHIDVKKLGRFQVSQENAPATARRRRPPRRRDAHGHDRGISGWDYVHVAVDDYSRLAYAEVLDDEKASTAIGFLKPGDRLLRPLRHHGRADPHRQRLRLHLDHPRARLPPPRHPPPPHPAPPPANQRQSRTLHPHHAQRLGLRSDLPHKPRTRQALDGWLWHYNHQRRHSALGHQPPASRTNLLGSYS